MKATFPFCNVKQAVGESNYQGPAPAVKKNQSVEKMKILYGKKQITKSR